MPNHSQDNQKNTPLLKVEGLTVNYGNVQALQDLSFEIQPGEILTLLGGNGAGKSTTLRAISGLLRPTKGKIYFQGSVISNQAPHLIVRKKISHVPEGRGIFANLTVQENLDLGAWTAPKSAHFQNDLEHVFGLFPRLKERRNQNAGTLSGGEQQMLAIGRALMAHPHLLLLDEPSLGLAPQIIEKIFEIITQINKEGVTVLLVEQNALQALQIAHHGLVLETGKKTIVGTSNQLLNSDSVRQAYLGG